MPPACRWPGPPRSIRSRRAGRVARMALKPADLHRALHEHPVDTGPLAEHLGRAGAGTAPAEDVGIEDRACRGKLIVMKYLANELRHVDVRRAGPRARGVEAIETARGFHPRLIQRKRRRNIGKSFFQSFRRLPVTRPEHGGSPRNARAERRIPASRQARARAAASLEPSSEPARLRGSQRPQPLSPMNLNWSTIFRPRLNVVSANPASGQP